MFTKNALNRRGIQVADQTKVIKNLIKYCIKKMKIKVNLKKNL